MSNRPCKYGCGVTLGDFDTKENKYKELDTGFLHTKERCAQFKVNGNNSSNNNKEPEGEIKATTAKDFVRDVMENTGPLEARVKELDDRVRRLEKIIDAFLMAGASN